ncbi:MAG: hypothetical protein IJO71_07975 [Microbacterium sp.]|uniref:hypothetical protein n=1 Tax=Microbacterium sp. TaxID=51671 RepID=UPI0025E05131|nr:hypothetical protein [Microbacterium sp.]MBQ9917121.1 hypothetical protein [Microbacterium sp.]
MPKRTIGMETIRVRPGRNRKSKFGKLSEIDGHDLLHIFHGWVASIPPDDLVDHQRGRYTKITHVTPRGRSVLVEIEAGYFGTAGQTFDVATHAISHSRSAGESATIMTRLVFAVAPDADFGVFVSEREGMSGGGPDLVKRFRHDLISHYPTFAFDVDTVIESDAWSKGADLLAVTAVAYSVPVDLAHGVVAVPVLKGRLQQRLEPEKGQKALPAGLLTALQDHKIKASDFMALPDGQSIDDTFVTVSRDGREKTYAIDKQKVPSVRVLISNDGEPPLTNQTFLTECLNEVRDLYQGMGFSWQESWRSGPWTKDQLQVTMPAKA